MTTTQKQIVDLLAGDAPLRSLLPDSTGLAASVHNRRLKRGSNEGATPKAFNATPGHPREGELLRSIVVADGGEVAHPSGPKRGTRLLAFDTFPRVHYYAEATESGKAAIDAMDARCMLLLHGWQVPGTTIRLEAEPERIPFVDSDEFPGNVETYRRFRGAGTRTIT